MQVSAVGRLDSCAERCVDPGKVAAVSESLLEVDEAVDLAEVFRLLGEPTRVRILFALLEGGV